MSDDRAWTIAIADWPHFQIVREEPRRWDRFGSDADLNGRFPTKLGAVESLIADYEEARATLNEQIARAKRMRRRLSAQTPKEPS